MPCHQFEAFVQVVLSAVQTRCVRGLTKLLQCYTISTTVLLVIYKLCTVKFSALLLVYIYITACQECCCKIAAGFDSLSLCKSSVNYLIIHIQFFLQSLAYFTDYVEKSVKVTSYNM